MLKVKNQHFKLNYVPVFFFNLFKKSHLDEITCHLQSLLMSF